MESTNVVVIDSGTESTKAGFAQDSFPRCCFPTLLARLRRSGLVDGFPDVCCGKQAVDVRGVSLTSQPVQNGLVTSFDDLEMLWHHTFYKELMVAPEETFVMHAVNPLIPRKHIETIGEILFETFATRGLYLGKSPTLAVHASGRTTGLVWESGAGCAHAAPVFEGFLLKHATVTSNLTGQFISDLFTNMLAKKGYSFTTPKEIDLMNKIKHDYCRVADSFDEARAAGDLIQFNLPDGESVLIGEERTACPEVLFNPDYHGFNCPNVIDCLSKSLSRCDMDYQRVFFENVVVCGGSSMLPGFPKRVASELTGRARSLLPYLPAACQVDALPARHHAAWLGGAVLGSLQCLKDFWITPEQYAEHGSDIMNQKFF